MVNNATAFSLIGVGGALVVLSVVLFFIVKGISFSAFDKSWWNYLILVAGVAILGVGAYYAAAGRKKGNDDDSDSGNDSNNSNDSTTPTLPFITADNNDPGDVFTVRLQTPSGGGPNPSVSATNGSFRVSTTDTLGTVISLNIIPTTTGGYVLKTTPSETTAGYANKYLRLDVDPNGDFLSQNFTNTFLFDADSESSATVFDVRPAQLGYNLFVRNTGQTCVTSNQGNRVVRIIEGNGPLYRQDIVTANLANSNNSSGTESLVWMITGHRLSTSPNCSTSTSSTMTAGAKSQLHRRAKAAATPRSPVRRVATPRSPTKSMPARSPPVGGRSGDARATLSQRNTAAPAAPTGRILRR